MHRDYSRKYMSNHIDLLFDFFHQYVNIGIKENIFNEFNKKSISIDFSSKSRQGDISSNFYISNVYNKLIYTKISYLNKGENEFLKLNIGYLF